MNKASLGDRRNGATYNLINNGADAIQDGQPHVIFVFASMREADHHRRDILEALERRRLPVKMSRKYDWDVAGCRVSVISLVNYEANVCGLPACEFIDHHAVEVADSKEHAFMMYRFNRHEHQFVRV
jgi:hypothetical protein